MYLLNIYAEFLIVPFTFRSKKINLHTYSVHYDCTYSVISNTDWRLFVYQVDVKCCCVFLSLSVGSQSEPSPFIPLNVRSTMSDQPATDTLIFCLPNLKLYSSGGRSLSRGMDVPVTNLEGPLTGEGERISLRDSSNLCWKCMNLAPSGICFRDCFLL